MARKSLVAFDFPSAPTVGGVSTWYVTPTGTNASGTWGISISGTAAAAPWSGITGKPTTVAGYGITDAIKYGEIIQNDNPFGGNRLYFNTLGNLLYLANSRYTVTSSGISPVSSIFDGDYESNAIVAAGATGVFTIDFGGDYNGYPYGDLLLSCYYNEIPQSVSIRVYCNYAPQGIGWKTLTVTKFKDSPTGTIFKANNQFYLIQQIEVTVVSPAGTQSRITQFELAGERPGNQLTPVFNKYRNEIAYKDINWVAGSPRVSGNLVLHAGNYNTYSPTLTGTGASGTWGISVSGNAATVTNGVYTTGDQNIAGKKVMTPTVATGTSTEQAFRIAPNALAGSPEWRNMFNIQSTYNAGVNGHALYIKANASNQFELVADWSTALRLGVITNAGNAANATAAKYLHLTTAAITWDGNALLDAGNYTTYTVTKTGGGASGSWGINITGSAATITGVYGGTLTSGQVTTALGYTPQTALTLTTTGTSGAATLVGGTLNIPQYAGGGSGTVTSVALSLPAIFSVTGSPVTTTGTLTAALASQTANYVWAAPNGAAGAPVFRALVAADIPTLNQNTTGSAGSVAWSGITSKPTTISGFGITDTVTQAITGYVSGTNTALAATDTIIAAFGKVQGQLNAKGAGTVTSVGGTGTVSGLTLSGTVTGSGNLTLGGTLSVAASNFASQTANTVLIAPNGTAGVPTFRALAAADIPTLNQNTTGSAGSVAWSGITSKPTTISGFGITDTVTQAITGYTAGTNTALAATDTIIAAFGKVQGQLNAKGAGTVTSVGLSLPALFTVTNSPVTGSGTLTGAFASQTANTVLAAPNGSAGAPTMRALVEADVPTLSQAKITNLTTDLAAKAPLASPTFTGTPVLTTTTTVGASGPVVGYRDIPITVSNTSITFVLADAGKGFGKDDTNPYTYNIPANSTTAFPVGTAITVFNNNATSNITIAITTDTLRLGGTTTTGSRTLAPFGVCTLLKVASTVWIASGAGLT